MRYFCRELCIKCIAEVYSAQIPCTGQTTKWHTAHSWFNLMNFLLSNLAFWWIQCNSSYSVFPLNKILIYGDTDLLTHLKSEVDIIQHNDSILLQISGWPERLHNVFSFTEDKIQTYFTCQNNVKIQSNSFLAPPCGNNDPRFKCNY